MSEFRIEKVRRCAVVTLAGGGTVQGDFFLQPTARYRVGPQHPAELFEEPDPFLPLAIAADQLVFIAKAQVIRVQFAADPADTEVGGVEEASVDVTCTDGSVASGQLRLETRADRPRLLDYLNGETQQFLTLHSPDGILLINRRQIVQVRQRR